jgi:hypothetical protein
MGVGAGRGKTELEACKWNEKVKRSNDTDNIPHTYTQWTEVEREGERESESRNESRIRLSEKREKRKVRE